MVMLPGLPTSIAAVPQLEHRRRLTADDPSGRTTAAFAQPRAGPGSAAFHAANLVAAAL
jgi:hypothetical protein